MSSLSSCLDCSCTVSLLTRKSFLFKAADTWYCAPQALLPVIREMGTPKGHARQSSLETRLALIAAAPWKGTLSVPSR